MVAKLTWPPFSMSKHKKLKQAALNQQNTKPKVTTGMQGGEDLAQVFGTSSEHPSKYLTPQKVHQILEAAEMGDVVAQSELFVDMEEKDGHIFTEMSKRKRALVGCDWSVVPPKNASAAEQALADEVGDWLEALPDFEDTLMDLLDALGHGFAAVEIEWQQIQGLWLPKTMHQRPQTWFSLKDNRLRLRSQGGMDEDLWPYGWLVHRHQARSGILARGGLMRTLVWPYMFKNYGVADFAEFLEIYGLPLRVGKYPAGASKEEKNTLIRALQGLGHNAAGIMPEAMAIEFINAAQGSNEPFMAMVEWCERTVSKVIIGGTLTSQADGKASTNALGNIHNEIRHDLLVSDAKQLASTLNRLIAMLVELNKGQINVRLPELQFDTRTPEDMQAYAEALPKLVEIGMQIPMSWAHEKLAIPQPAEGEAVLGLNVGLKTEASSDKTLAKLNYRQVGLNQQQQVVPLAQLQLDEAIDQMAIGTELPQQLAQIAQGLGLALAQGLDYEDAADKLVMAYPHITAEQLQSALARALFVADIWGQINGQS